MITFLVRFLALQTILLFDIAPTITSWQETATVRPSFEVASIKPNSSAGPTIPRPWTETADYFAWTGPSLKNLIQTAYRVRDWQIEGGPDWVNTQLWDVEARAKAEGVDAPPKTVDRNAQHARLMLMLQSLLEDRFKLQIQRQVKESSVYNLVVSKGGPRIKPDDVPISGTQPSRPGMSSTLNSIEVRASAIQQFITFILPRSDRPILDRTNLSGTYSFRLEWPLDNSGSGGLAGSTSPIRQTSLYFVPGFFTALQEQLGLQLESAKGPVEFLVITNVQKPSGS